MPKTHHYDYNLRICFVKGVGNSNLNVPGITTNDVLISASRATFHTAATSTTSITGIAYLTIAQFSISAANTIHKNGTPKTYTNLLLIVLFAARDD
jgi:hypothetical protein